MDKLNVKTYGLNGNFESVIVAVLAEHSSVKCQFQNTKTPRRLRLATAIKNIGVWADCKVVLIPPISEYTRATASLSEVLGDGVVVACVGHQDRILSLAVEGRNFPIWAVDHVIEESLKEA